MACTHPFGIERLERTLPDGTVQAGGRCPACGMVGWVGESWWTTIKRALRACFGRAAE